MAPCKRLIKFQPLGVSLHLYVIYIAEFVYRHTMLNKHISSSSSSYTVSMRTYVGHILYVCRPTYEVLLQITIRLEDRLEIGNVTYRLYGSNKLLYLYNLPFFGCQIMIRLPSNGSTPITLHITTVRSQALSRSCTSPNRRNAMV